MIDREPVRRNPWLIRRLPDGWIEYTCAECGWSRAESAKSLELPVALRAHVKTHREAHDVA